MAPAPTPKGSPGQDICDDPQDPYRRNLELIADATGAAAAEFGLEPVHATQAEVHASTG